MWQLVWRVAINPWDEKGTYRGNRCPWDAAAQSLATCRVIGTGEGMKTKMFTACPWRGAKAA